MNYSLKLKGSALVYILIIMSAVLIILSSMVQYIASQIKYSYYQSEKEESLQIAEAGIYFYRWYLAHEVEGKTAAQIKDFWQNENPYGVSSSYEREYTDPQGAGIGKFSIDVTPPDPYSTIVIVQSTGWTYKNPNSQRTVRVRFRRPSWSEFSVLANANIRFGDGTEVYGPLHSNGGIRFDGVAHNIVSSNKTDYADPDPPHVNRPGVWTSWAGEYNTNMGSDVFLAGKDFPVPEKDFNGTTADLALMKQAANDSSTYFDNSEVGRHIILKTDGNFDIRTVQSYDQCFNHITSYSGSWQTNTIPDNGVIFVEDNVWLEGKINGDKVTVVAADLVGGGSPNIFIEHDIEYTAYDGSDIIGIIAENDIEIIRNSENDLRIDGALMAQIGRVGRLHYAGYCKAWWWIICIQSCSCNDHKNTITTYGSMATNQRYGFAYTDGTGYTNRNLIYDNNLLYYPPPYFPTGTEYSLDLWDEL